MKIEFKKGLDKNLTALLGALRNMGLYVEWPPEIDVKTEEQQVMGRTTPIMLHSFEGTLHFRIPEHLIDVHKEDKI